MNDEFQESAESYEASQAIQMVHAAERTERSSREYSLALVIVIVGLFFLLSIWIAYSVGRYSIVSDFQRAKPCPAGQMLVFDVPSSGVACIPGDQK